jgi:hypothetical protein
MSRLQKFIETATRGGTPLRIAYALGAGKLPAPETGARLVEVDGFNAADELLEKPLPIVVYFR